MLPVLLKIGPLPVYTFGLLLGIGFLISLFIVYRFAKKEYFDEEKVFDTVFLSILVGFLGARLVYIIEHFDIFGFNFLDWILINARPGLSIWGGVGVCFSVFLLSVKKGKLPLYKMLDMITIPTVVLLIFAYMGAFFAGSVVGTPTIMPWGVIFFSTIKRHPVSLYQAIFAIFTLVLLIRLKEIFQNRKMPAGSLFYSSVFIIAFFSIVSSSYKETMILLFDFVKGDHLIYLLLFLLSGILLYQHIGRNLKNDVLIIFNKVKLLIKRKGQDNEKISQGNS